MPECGAYLGQRKLGPPGKVAEGGRPVAAEVAHQELTDRLLTLEYAGCGDPLIESRDQLLVAGKRSQHQPAVPAQRAEKVDAALAMRCLAAGIEYFEQLRAADGTIGQNPVQRQVPRLL